MLTVTLPDGAQKQFESAVTVHDVAASIGAGLAGAALAGRVNGELVDTSHVIDSDAVVAIVTGKDDDGLEVIRHSCAHLMAQAVQRLFPKAQVTIGPTIEDGFFYDFAYDRPFTPEDLEQIEKEMSALVAQSQSVTRSVMSRQAAVALFEEKGEHYKVEILKSIPDAEDLSFYQQGDFVDLCRGPHVPDTGYLGHFKLMRVAGAYWRGDEKRQMLQRIYGTAWSSKKELKQHLERLEEAAKRDHRKLATELDLLSFPTELGGGLAVWHPKGAAIRKIMEDYSRQRHEEGGYEFVYTPHLANERLFQTSGHLDFYADGMYPAMEMDNGTYYPKPMNCPMHCLIFGHGQRSYKELPLRLFELGTVYRYERSGTLHGLMRIRGFTQDDSHLFVASEQLLDEITSLLDFVLSVLRAFGFDDFTFNLSTKDPEKYVGDDAIWDKSTAALREALDRHGLEYAIKDADAAFYGPKIDIDVKDAIGRSWQLSTIQCDFNLPDRFDLTYVGQDGERHRPIMLHRALFGSIERFFGVLIEHYNGAFPTWLSPTQVQVLGVRADHDDYAASVATQLRAYGIRAEVIEADDPLGARIRKGKLEKIPYLLVVGDDDVANNTAGVNPRGGNVERDITIDSFIERITTEIDNKVTAPIT